MNDDKSIQLKIENNWPLRSSELLVQSNMQSFRINFEINIKCLDICISDLYLDISYQWREE